MSESFNFSEGDEKSTQMHRSVQFFLAQSGLIELLKTLSCMHSFAAKDILQEYYIGKLVNVSVIAILSVNQNYILL